MRWHLYDSQIANSMPRSRLSMRYTHYLRMYRRTNLSRQTPFLVSSRRASAATSRAGGASETNSSTRARSDPPRYAMILIYCGRDDGVGRGPS